MAGIVCWKCGAELKGGSLPIGTYDLCPVCRCDLHVCVMCRSYDPNVSGKCRKEEADYVSNKEHSNYCHYFKPRAGAYQAKTKSAVAHDELAELFGKESSDADSSQDYDAKARQAKDELGALFGDEKDEKEDARSPEEKARRELEKLFSKDND